MVYEDRPHALVGVKLVVLSLARRSPGLRVAVTVPGASTAFRRWVAAQDNAELHPLNLDATGWNVKPWLLLHHLHAGNPRVVWLDADVIVTGDLEALLDRLPAQALVVAQDVWWGRAQGRPDRTLAWGLVPGRILPVTANTALVGVSPAHVPLLEAWAGLLATKSYRYAQTLEWQERPLHLWGDQEVLTALLGAEAWRHVEVAFLRRGRDIAQCYGAGSFTPAERLALRLRRQLPVLVHAMGPKPWEPQPTSWDRTLCGRFWAAVERGHQHLSPYCWAAFSYRDQLGSEVHWSELHGMGARLAAVVGDDPLLRELPLAVIDASRWLYRRGMGRLRRVARKKV